MHELREIRDKMSEEIKDLSKEQLKNYFNNQKKLFPAKK